MQLYGLQHARPACPSLFSGVCPIPVHWTDDAIQPSHSLLPSSPSAFYLFHHLGLDVKSWLAGKDPDAGKDWRQKEKRATENEKAGRHHQFNGHELGQTLGYGEGQGNLACCSPWDSRVGHDLVTEQQQSYPESLSLFFLLPLSVHTVIIWDFTYIFLLLLLCINNI